MSEVPKDINTLYSEVAEGKPCAESELFQLLTVSFRLFVRHKVMSSSDCEEVVQEALTAIAEKYRVVEFQSGFATWAYRVLNNKIVDYYRYRKVRSGKVILSSEESSAASALASNPDLRRRLLDCLKKLNHHNRFHARALNLHYQGYNTAEICKRLAVTPNNFYVMLSRARSMLQICLERGVIST